MEIDILFGARTVLGIAYPAYASFDALKRKNAVEQRQWLAFWLVQSLFATIEGVGPNVVDAVPLYWELKIAALLWMIIPGGQHKSPLSFFDGLLAPILSKCEGNVDAGIAKVLHTAEIGLRKLSHNLQQNF